MWLRKHTRSSRNTRIAAPVARARARSRARARACGTAPTSSGSLRVAVGLPVARHASATTPASILYWSVHRSGRDQTAGGCGASDAQAFDTPPRGQRPQRTALNKPQRTALNKPQSAQSARRKGHTALALAPSRLPSTPKPLFLGGCRSGFLSVSSVSSVACSSRSQCSLWFVLACLGGSVNHKESGASSPTISTRKGTMPAWSRPRGGPLGVHNHSE
jgi:hypothetical protein